MNFPTPVTALPFLTEPFTSIGTQGGFQVICEDDEDIEVLWQRQPRRPEGQTLCANTPSIPLINPTTSVVETPFVHIGKLEEEKRSLASRLTMLKNKVALSKKRDKALYNHLEQARDVVLEGSLPLIREQNSKLFRDIIDNMNIQYHKQREQTLYSDGCLAYNFSDSSPFILHAGGSRLNNLYKSNLSYKDGDLNAHSSRVKKFQNRSQIFQLSSKCFGNNCYCVIRRKNSCEMLVGEDAELRECFEKTWDDNTLVLSCAASPFIAGEFVCATDKGDIYIGRNDSVEELYTNLTCRAEVMHPVWHINYAAHPRQLVIMEPASLDIYDIRFGDRSQNTLFSIPHKCVRKGELLRLTMQHPDRHFYHIVSTDSMLFLLDERFPAHPVLHWPHFLQSAPRHMDISVTNNAEDVMLLASSFPAETVVMSIKFTGSNVPVSTDSTWKLSSPRDFVRMVDTDNINIEAVTDRLKLPLAGVSAVPILPHNGFSALQMTVSGDIFVQTYLNKPVEEMVDKTFSCGPGFSSEWNPLTESQKASCSQWLHTAQEVLEKQKLVVSPEKGKLIHCTEHIFNMASQAPYANLSCVLCMASEKQHQGSVGQHLLCRACCNTLSEATDIWYSATEHTVYAEKVDEQYTVNIMKQIDVTKYIDPASQIINKLMAGDDDIKELMAQEISIIEKRVGVVRNQDKTADNPAEDTNISQTTTEASVQNTTDITASIQDTPEATARTQDFTNITANMDTQSQHSEQVSTLDDSLTMKPPRTRTFSFSSEVSSTTSTASRKKVKKRLAEPGFESPARPIRPIRPSVQSPTSSLHSLDDIFLSPRRPEFLTQSQTVTVIPDSLPISSSQVTNLSSQGISLSQKSSSSAKKKRKSVMGF